MAYARELDSLRQEARQSVATTIVFWPKNNGLNTAVETDGTFEVFDPAGSSIQGPTTIDGTLVDDVDRYDIPVSAIADLDEDYRVDVLWEVAGESFVHRNSVYFDVVLMPYGDPSVSLNDLLEERVDIGEVLDRHGQLLGQTAGDVAQEFAAAVYSVRARVELDAMIRSQINADAGTMADPSHPTTYATGRTRPHLILNRERLNRVERKLALRAIYASDMGSEDGEESWLWRHYDAEVQRAWAGVGPLRYDSNEDAVPDTTLDDIGRVVIQRREQG